MEKIKLDGRLGFSLELSQEDFNVLTGDDRVAARDLLVDILQSNQFEICGDTYFPVEWNEEVLTPIMQEKGLTDLDIEDNLAFDVPSINFGENNLEQNKLNRVEDRLPDEDVRVLVCIDSERSDTKIDTDRMLNGKWIRWGTDVTHWMDLPPELSKTTEDVKDKIEDEVKVVRSMEELKAYIEDKGWSIYEDENDWEICQGSPAGEDFSFVIEHNNDVEKTINKIKQYVCDFNVNEHAEMWGRISGEPDVETLIEDAKAIQEILDELADGVACGEMKTIGEIVSEATDRATKGNKNTAGKETIELE